MTIFFLFNMIILTVLGGVNIFFGYPLTDLTEVTNVKGYEEIIENNKFYTILIGFGQFIITFVYQLIIQKLIKQ